MTMYNTLHRGQSNASPFKCIRLMQALKHAKQFIYILHIKTYSVVPNEHHYLISVSVGAPDFNFSLRARAREFDRIGKKVNQCEPQHRTISIEIGQCADFPDN